MDKQIADLVGEVRTAIDEIVGSDIDSDFVSIVDTEITQALKYAALQLCQSLPDEMLTPQTLSSSQFSPVVISGGKGTILLPVDFVRLTYFKMAGWAQGVRELTDPLSEEGKMQSSDWTCGTPEKPVAMLSGEISNNQKILQYYSASKNGQGGYVHTVEALSYIGEPTITGGTLHADLRADCEPLLVYRAAALLMEGKQYSALADRFYKLSTVVTAEA